MSKNELKKMIKDLEECQERLEKIGEELTPLGKNQELMNNFAMELSDIGSVLSSLSLRMYC